MSPSQALLQFQVCPEEDKEEESEGLMFYQTIIGLEGDTEETLTCLATWPNPLDTSETYMVGTLDFRYKRTQEERVRCFLVKETKRGLAVAQGKDSTCNTDLVSSLS